MKLTREQRSELISKWPQTRQVLMSWFACFWIVFPSRSAPSFSRNTRVNKPMVSVPVVGEAMVGVSNFASLVRAPMLFNQSFLVFCPLRSVSARSFFMSCIPVDFPVKTSPRWGVAYTVTFITPIRDKQGLFFALK